jgi:hypothetical protein
MSYFKTLSRHYPGVKEEIGALSEIQTGHILSIILRLLLLLLQVYTPISLLRVQHNASFHLAMARAIFRSSLCLQISNILGLPIRVKGKR